MSLCGNVIFCVKVTLIIHISIILTVDQKIAGLDNELRKYKEQLKKATGPTAANIKKRAMDVLKRKVGTHVIHGMLWSFIN